MAYFWGECLLKLRGGQSVKSCMQIWESFSSSPLLSTTNIIVFAVRDLERCCCGPAHFPQDCWQQLLYCIFKMSSSSSNGSSSHSKTLVQIAAKNRHKQKCGYPVQTSRSSPSIALNPKLKYLHQHQGIQASPQKRRGVSAEPTR